MVVDKAGRDDLAVGVDVRVGGPDNLPISTILPSLTPTSPRNAGAARAVDDAAVLDQQIIGHRSASLSVDRGEGRDPASQPLVTSAGVDPGLRRGDEAWQPRQLIRP